MATEELSSNMLSSGTGPAVTKLVYKDDGSLATNKDGSVITEVVEAHKSSETKSNEVAEPTIDTNDGQQRANTSLANDINTDASCSSIQTVLSPEEVKLRHQAELEAKCIEQGRRNAMGQLVLSAEPYNYWQDLTIQPSGFMNRVVGVYFNNTGRWNPSSLDVKQLIEVDLGFKEDAKEKITAVGRNRKRITLTAKTMEIKREIYNLLTEKFYRKYSCVSFEDPAVDVTFSFVPEDMPDEVLRKDLTRYGDLSNDPTVFLKCDLGYHNLQRKIVFSKLVYDLPSYLKVQGYTIQARYNGQRRTCRLCGQVGHMADSCPQNVSVQKKTSAPQKSDSAQNDVQEKMDDEVDCDKIVKVVQEVMALSENHEGSMVNSPALKQVVQDQLKKFKESAKRRRNVKSKVSQSNSEFTVVGRKRGNGNNIPSYRRPLQDAKITQPHIYDAKNKKFKSSNYDSDFPQGLDAERVPKRQQKQHDYYDGMPPTRNRFSALAQDDLDLSSTDEEQHREYIRN